MSRIEPGQVIHRFVCDAESFAWARLDGSDWFFSILAFSAWLKVKGPRRRSARGPLCLADQLTAATTASYWSSASSFRLAAPCFLRISSMAGVPSISR